MIWVTKLISLAVALQSLEMLWVPAWGWNLIRSDFPRPWTAVLASHRLLAGFSLAAAGIAMVNPSQPVPLAIMLFSTWTQSWRWRGTFNGGSDVMTLHILAAACISSLSPDFERACLVYISVQLVLSYFVAGAVKWRNAEWRNGKALQEFLRRAGWSLPLGTCLALAWGVLSFEMLFPLACFAPLPFAAIGVLFHLANVYVFGLNRFFFAWLAAYPALFTLVG